MKSIITISIRLITLFVALIFVNAGLSKITGSPHMVDSFYRWGYPDWFRSAIGLFEVTAAITLLIPRTSSYAAASLSFLMFGAIATHLRWQEYSLSLPAVLLGGVTTFLMFARQTTFVIPEMVAWSLSKKLANCPIRKKYDAIVSRPMVSAQKGDC